MSGSDIDCFSVLGLDPELLVDYEPRLADPEPAEAGDDGSADSDEKVEVPA